MRSVPVLLVALLAACTTQLPSPPSEAEARAFLDRIVETALRNDFEALCDLGGGNCESFLAEPGGKAVPPDPPMVVGTRRVEQRTSEQGGRPGGHVLELCGRDANGEPYYSEVLVNRSVIGELRAIEPLYWMGIIIADDGITGRDPDQSTERCAAVAG